MKHDSYTICSNNKDLIDVYVNDFWSVQLFHIENLLKWIIVLLTFIALEMVFN